MAEKRQKPEGTGEITVTGIPKNIIAKLNKLAKNRMGVSRNSFLKTKFFDLVRGAEKEGPLD